jgi:hypothetical protein
MMKSSTMRGANKKPLPVSPPGDGAEPGNGRCHGYRDLLYSYREITTRFLQMYVVQTLDGLALIEDRQRLA